MGIGNGAFGAKVAPENLEPAETCTTIGHPTTGEGIAAQGTEQQIERQFADEIIRRLRRLGINFSKTRLARPYGIGDIC
jgi:hypothetical protein